MPSAGKVTCATEPGTDTVVALEPLRQRSGKVVYAWAMKSDFDPSTLESNSFSMEWPPKSSRHQDFPEIDRAAWFEIESAAQKITRGQAPFLAQLHDVLGHTR